ncbi:MAG: carbamoyl-phosphate synthase large subunit [Anaerolineae bacterium]
MLKNTSISSILIIGSGPIVIGQGCEFDYSGTQACKALRREGYRIVLVNSNPATIMTDPEMADATYIEPLTPEFLEKIIAKEKPDALLPTVGGQTALNLAVQLAERGILEKYNVKLLGAPIASIQMAEDRLLFRAAMERIGLPTPKSGVAHTLDEARALLGAIGYPALIRPSFTLGGSGGGIVYTEADIDRVIGHGLRESPVSQVLVEQSVLGWKEYELEVMRDGADNFVVVCSIENIDPMGVHTGDSITVAPAQTLTDKEYQRLREMARAVLKEIGVATGGANVQFGVNPANGDVVVIEMNPRVSRSSALASKATGFPIAKIAALLAVGYTLDEIRNDITRETPASFEPSLDYCVVKIPRWNFEKFPGADRALGPQMKSVGEVMAIGRTFPEALNKAIRGLEIGEPGFGKHLLHAADHAVPTVQKLYKAAASPVSARGGMEAYDPWFIAQCAAMIETEREIEKHTLADLPSDLWARAKRMGFSDRMIAQTLADAPSPAQVRQTRKALGLVPSYYRVDTCAAEFVAHTPYLYSTWEGACESRPTSRRKVMILGGGPNRIGQGIEFDYCCVSACFALREMGFETIMVNCNPETVSTDYDTADRLYFEPLTLEDVLNIIELEKPEGVIVQFGGQTPIRLAEGLAQAGAPIWGTSAANIDLAEDRLRFGALLDELQIDCPKWGAAQTLSEAEAIAERIGYPVLVRPSYVLGGRAMEIVYTRDALDKFWAQALAAATDAETGRTPTVLIDHYLEDAVEVDMDALCDGERVVVAGVMQHIEEAGIHSGDSACVLPPFKVSQFHLNTIEEYTRKLGMALGAMGLMNIQFAIKDDVVYVLEVNPRASRTVPFVSKATGVPLARIAARIMAGETLAQIGLTETPALDGFYVKEAVLPFRKFPDADALLGPEMRSTGEVMGGAPRFGLAFAKAQMAAGTPIPASGNALISVNDFDKGAALKIARDLRGLGFNILATGGTAAFFRKAGLDVQVVNKVGDPAPNLLTLVQSGQVQLLLNTPLGRGAYDDSRAMRMAAVLNNVLLLTTLSAAQAAVAGLRQMREMGMGVRSLQERG